MLVLFMYLIQLLLQNIFDEITGKIVQLAPIQTSFGRLFYQWGLAFQDSPAFLTGVNCFVHFNKGVNAEIRSACIFRIH